MPAETRRTLQIQVKPRNMVVVQTAPRTYLTSCQFRALFVCLGLGTSDLHERRHTEANNGFFYQISAILSAPCGIQCPISQSIAEALGGDE